VSAIVHALGLAGLVVGCVAALAAVFVVVDDFLHRDREGER
jgi:hypothetical protein